MKKLVFLLFSLISYVVLADDAYRWRDQSLTPRSTDNGATVTGGPQELQVTRNIPLDRSGLYPVNAYGVPNPTFEIDFSQSPPGAGNTFTANTGQTLTQRGTITMQTDGTWPSGTSGSQGYEWTFDGASSYINSTIGPPAGDFSALCIVMPTGTPTATIIGNYDGASNKRGWQIYQITNTVAFVLSDDGTAAGGHFSSVSVASSIYPGRVSIVAGTYDYIADGSSVMKLYVDNLTAASTTSANGPVYSGADYLSIGANGGSLIYFAGTISHCAYWDGVILTPGQVANIRNVWMGMLSTSGVPVTTTSAAPPALMVAGATSGTEPFLRSYGANLNTVSHNGTCSGLYGPSTVTNLFRRALFRTWTTDAGCGRKPTNVPVYCIAGDGSSAVSEDNTTKAVDVYSARFTLTGTTSAAYGYSTCRTTEIGQNIKFSIWYKCSSGTCDSKLWLREFTSAADCSGAYVDNSVVCTPSGTNWVKCQLTLASGAWNGSTQSYRVMFSEFGNGGVTSNWSAPMMRASATSMPLDIDQFCGADTDADAYCSAIINSTPSFYSANGPMSTTLTGCTPYDGVDTSTSGYMVSDGTYGGANSILYYVSATYREPVLNCFDNTGTTKHIFSNILDWSRLTPYALKYTADGSGNMREWWNNTWQTTVGGAGTGIKTAGQPTTYIGSSSTAGSDTYVKNLVIQPAIPADPDPKWGNSIPK